MDAVTVSVRCAHKFASDTHLLGDWKDTFQRIPTSIDNILRERGAKRLLVRGSADAADNDIFNDFEKWEDHEFWPTIRKTFGSEDGADDMAGLEIEVSTTLRSSHLRQDVKEAIVVKNELLGTGTEAPTRHIKLKLPTDMTYRAGDYLAVLPINHLSVVRRVIKRFCLPWDAFVTVKSGESYLPVGQPMSVFDVLSAYVELSQTMTRRVSCLLSPHSHSANHDSRILRQSINSPLTTQPRRS